MYNRYTVTTILFSEVKVGLTEAVPTVGGERMLVFNRYTVTTMLLILFNVGLTEVVPTVGGERGEGAYI